MREGCAVIRRVIVRIPETQFQKARDVVVGVPTADTPPLEMAAWASRTEAARVDLATKIWTAIMETMGEAADSGECIDLVFGICACLDRRGEVDCPVRPS